MHTPTFLAALRRSYAWFPEVQATITIRPRSWWSGIFISRAWTLEWAGAYRNR